MGALYKGFWTATLARRIPAIYGAVWYALGGDLNQTVHRSTARHRAFPA